MNNMNKTDMSYGAMPTELPDRSQAGLAEAYGYGPSAPGLEGFNINAQMNPGLMNVPQNPAFSFNRADPRLVNPNPKYGGGPKDEQANLKLYQASGQHVDPLSDIWKDKPLAANPNVRGKSNKMEYGREYFFQLMKNDPAFLQSAEGHRFRDMYKDLSGIQGHWNKFSKLRGPVELKQKGYTDFIPVYNAWRKSKGLNEVGDNKYIFNHGGQVEHYDLGGMVNQQPPVSPAVQPAPASAGAGATPDAPPPNAQGPGSGSDFTLEEIKKAAAMGDWAKVQSMLSGKPPGGMPPGMMQGMPPGRPRQPKPNNPMDVMSRMSPAGAMAGLARDGSRRRDRRMMPPPDGMPPGMPPGMMQGGPRQFFKGGLVGGHEKDYDEDVRSFKADGKALRGHTKCKIV